MASLDLNDRNALKTMIASVQKDAQAKLGAKISSNFTRRATGMLSKLAGADANIDEADAKAELEKALEGAKGTHFVGTKAALKSLDKWIAPFRPQPEPAAEEGEEGGE